MKRRGFTLIELLIVIAIIGVLATIIFINLSSATERSKFTKVKSDLKTIDDAVTLAFANSPDGDVKGTKSGLWDDFAEECECSIDDSCSPYDKAELKDTLGNDIISVYPAPPDPVCNDNDGFGGFNGTYKLYIRGYNDHATGIEPPEWSDGTTGGQGATEWCVYKGGSYDIGGTGVERRAGGEVVGNEEYCSPE